MSEDARPLEEFAPPIPLTALGLDWRKLYSRWLKRRRVLRVFRDYAEGKHNLAYSSQLFKSRYADHLSTRLGSLRENLCMAVVYGFTESIEVKTWGTAAADEKALDLGLDRFTGYLVDSAFVYGSSFAVVWPNARGVLVPVQVNALEAVAEQDPEDPATLLWFARVWLDKDTYRLRLNIYTSDALWRFESDEVYEGGVGSIPEPPPMHGYSDATAGPVVLNSEAGLPAGVLPVVMVKVDAVGQMDPGRSILTDVIPLQDAVNKSLNDMVIAGERYAIPLIYLLNYITSTNQTRPLNPYAVGALGVPATSPASAPTVPGAAPGVPATPGASLGATVEVIGAPGASKSGGPAGFDQDKQQIFATSAAGPMGSIDPPDLAKQLKVGEGLANAIGRVVGLPTYYFTGALMDVPSGESLRVLMSRRLARIRKFERDNGPVLRGLKVLLGLGPEPIKWANAAYQSEAERYTIAINMQQLGFPVEEILRYLDYPDPEGLARQMTPQAPTPVEDGGLVGNPNAIKGANSEVERL